MSKAAESCKIVLDDDGQVSDFVCQKLGLDCAQQKIAGAIGFAINGELIGGVVFTDLCRNDNVWINIFANDRHWCCRRILQVIFGIAFELWGCRRINALIDVDNPNSFSLAEGVGFVCEGKMRQYRKIDKDVYVLGMLKNECKFLKK